MARILHLTLKRKWFDLIASGKKKVEYREIKTYWTKRLFVGGFRKVFDEIHFVNGYGKQRPFMRVEWDGMDYDWFNNKKCYAIKLGKILEISDTERSSTKGERK